MSDKSNRKTAWTMPVVLGLLALLAGGAVRVLASGPGPHPAEPGGAMPADAPGDEHNPGMQGDVAPAADGSDGTVRLGNARCPVLGGPVDAAVGVAFNGWWINFCCPGCDETFAKDPSAYATRLLAETGIDIRLAPQQEAERANAPWRAGPNLTRDLGNAVCPVSNSPTRGDVGVEVNGWWVRVCSPVCASVFVSRLDRYSPRVVELVGVDVRTIDGRPITQPAQSPSTVAPEPPSGTEPSTLPPTSRNAAAINTRCPVTGNPANGDFAVSHNGWVIAFCSAGCLRQFMADPDARAVAFIKETGHDIRFTPDNQPAPEPAHGPTPIAPAPGPQPPALPDLPAGPDDTVRLGNAVCPVMGNPTTPTNDVGVAVNGWWVSFCCPMCKQRLLDNIDKYAPALLEQTGHDVRNKPR